MGYKEIGQRLQKAREEAGLSQEELARKLGCTQASLSNYELGKRRMRQGTVLCVASKTVKKMSLLIP